MSSQAVIEDRNGEMHVFLSDDGDHIVIKFMSDPKTGGSFETMLPHGSLAWERAVKRAAIAAAFL